jgi:hypothetical protein
MRMDGKCCMTCASSWWTDKSQMKLICLRLDFHPPCSGYCDEHVEAKDEEKLIITDEFVDVIRMLRGI